MSLFLVRMKKFQSKMKALEWSQHFSHCKHIEFFSDPQGQLTQQSMVWFKQYFIQIIFTSVIQNYMLINTGSDGKQELIFKSMVCSGLSNSSETLWLSL